MFLFLVSLTFSATARKDGRRFTDECIFCWVKEPDVEFSPCKHICFCNECFRKLEDPLCAFCRTEIQKVRVIKGRELNKMRKIRIRNEESSIEAQSIKNHQKNLLNDDPKVSLDALQALINLGNSNPEHKERVGVLACVLLRHDSVAVRDTAGDAICRFVVKGDQTIVKLVCLHLEDPREYVRAKAIEILGEIGGIGTPAFDKIVQALGDESTRVKWEALGALVKFSDLVGDTIIEIVLLLMNRRVLREKAVECIGHLGQRGDTRIISALHQVISLPDKDAHVHEKRAAFVVLTQITPVGDEDTMTFLLKFMQDHPSSSSLIKGALYCVARIANPEDCRAFQAIKDVMHNGVEKQAKKAMSCLRQRANENKAKSK